MKDEFYFPSKDGNTEIHTIEWKPEGHVKAVLQLSHGMVEYVDRYSDLHSISVTKDFMLLAMTIWGMESQYRANQSMDFLMKNMEMHVSLGIYIH